MVVCAVSPLSPPHIRCIVSGAWLRDLRIGFSLGRSQVSYSLSSAFFDHCYRNLGFPQPNTRIACCLHYSNSPSLPYYQFILITPVSPFRVLRLPKFRKPSFYAILSYCLLYLFTYLWTLIGLHHSHLPSEVPTAFQLIGTYRDVPCFGYTGHGHWSICISS